MTILLSLANRVKVKNYFFYILRRCQKVISKLHKDCETVARQNADIVGYTKECDARIKEVLTAGRHSAKQRTVPKKAQDIFENLMDDIEKLVKTRKKVLNKETEGRRHSTRIIRQCRDWLSGRSLALQKLNTTTGTLGPRGHAHPASEETENGAVKESPKPNDNAIMSILESLQLLEKELQEYVHQEVSLSDKYRAELRRKHLQKQVHGFSVQGFEDMESTLKTLEKNPEKVAECIAVLQSSVNEINKEYGECVFFINKIVSQDSNENGANPSPRPEKKDTRTTPRNWPDNHRLKPATMAGKPARSHDNNVNYLGKERSEPNQLLSKIRQLVEKYDAMKSEDQLLSSKHRSEMSRKKRDVDIVLQKKDDHIMRLQMQLKEAEAEKEKYKKLYNDTKIGYQKNYESVTSPRLS